VNELSGYSITGDQISFKILDSSENTLIDMYADVNTDWDVNSMNVINLTDMQPIPEKITFGSAYPNPFNPTTMLSYSVPREMDVEVMVYDMAGRLVSELVNNTCEPGIHEVHWDASQQSSGIYFVTIHAGSEVMTQKLMLIK